MRCRRCDNEVDINAECDDVTCNDCLKHLSRQFLISHGKAYLPCFPEPQIRPNPLTNIYMHQAGAWRVYQMRTESKREAIFVFGHLNKD